MNIPHDIKIIHEIFSAAGKQLFVVGGCVRDHLLGSNIKDYDMATDAMPEEITSLLQEKYRLDFTGKSFGVIRVYTKECPKGYEIATFREDTSVGRQPTVRLGATIDEDVKRRDFTINALFFDLDKNEIVDLVGGVDDIENSVLRCVGVAEDRFNEDRLRVLRAVRFALRFGFVMDAETAEAIRKCSVLEGPNSDGDIVPIVRERINEEMIKSLDQIPAPFMYFITLNEYGILGQVLPGHIFPDELADSTSSEVIIASLYLGSRPGPEFFQKVLKLTNKMSDGIELLLDADKLAKETNNIATFAYTIAKRRSRLDNISDEDMSVFLHWALAQESARFNSNALAFSVYKLSVTGQELIEEGFAEGAEMGEELKRREAGKFNTLLQSCGRVIRNGSTIKIVE